MTINIIGEINEQTVSMFLKKTEKAIANSAPFIIINLCSEGGYQYDALAIYGRIRSLPMPVIVRAYGKVMSAATIILAGASERFLAPETWIMVHDSPESKSGTPRELLQAQREEDQWANILAQHSHTSAIEWRAISARDSYLTPAEAIQLGIADVILKGKT